MLFTSLTLAGFVSLMRSRSWPATVLGGLCFGLAVLVRPIALLLPVAGIWLTPSGTSQQKLRSLALVYIVLFSVSLPWTIRNTRVLRTPVWVSTNFGINFWMGNHDGATGRYRFTPEMELAAARINDEAAFDSYARTRALDFIREHPGQAFGLVLRKTILFWSPAMDGVKGVFPRDRSWQAKVFAALHRLSYFGLWVLLGAALLWRHPPSPGVLLLMLYYTAVYAVIVAEPRYHIPAIPWLALGAAAAALPRACPRSPGNLD